MAAVGVWGGVVGGGGVFWVWGGGGVGVWGVVWWLGGGGVGDGVGCVVCVRGGGQGKSSSTVFLLLICDWHFTHPCTHTS